MINTENNSDLAVSALDVLGPVRGFDDLMRLREQVGAFPDFASQLLKRLRCDLELVQWLSEQWLHRHSEPIGSLDVGTAVVIDLMTGKYVIASTRMDALDAFEARFGIGQTVGWLHQVGGGIKLGGGLG